MGLGWRGRSRSLSYSTAGGASTKLDFHCSKHLELFESTL
jgi:hypothetical protein